MKNENMILAVINGSKTFVWNHGKQLLTIIALMPPQNSCPIQRIQSYLAIRSYASIQACGATMSNEQQARKMLTSIAKTSGGFEYAGEYYAACCAFLSGTDPSMPSKTLIQRNELNIDRLLKVTGGSSKMHIGDGLITKAKRDRAELQNCYMPLLTNEVVRTYLNIGSGKTWEQIQEEFRLRLWQERCKGLLNENMKDAEKALKDAQGRFRSFEDATTRRPEKSREMQFLHART